jgi:hypothetical protein
VNTQFITSDLKLATVLAFAGYKMIRTVVDPTGKQFLFENPGDIDLLVADYENNMQGVSDAKGLLEIFEEQLQSQSGKSNAATAVSAAASEVHPTTRESDGRRWYTKDMRTAVFLHYAGYELLSTDLADATRTVFWFAHDSELDELIRKFNRRELLVEPQAFHDAGFKVRDAMREAKGFEVKGFTPASTSMYKSPATIQRDDRRAQERRERLTQKFGKAS